MEIIDFVLGLLPALITGVCMALFNRRLTRRDQETKAHLHEREQESQLLLQLQMATAKLSHVTATALSGGKLNGNVEEAMGAYREAKTNYVAFVNAQVAKNLLND